MISSLWLGNLGILKHFDKMYYLGSGVGRCNENYQRCKISCPQEFQGLQEGFSGSLEARTSVGQLTLSSLMKNLERQGGDGLDMCR